MFRRQLTTSRGQDSAGAVEGGWRSGGSQGRSTPEAESLF